MRNVIGGLFILVLIGIAGWYGDAKLNQERVDRKIRDTAECHMEAFKVQPGSVPSALEVQYDFMDICMEARGYVFTEDCTERIRKVETDVPMLAPFKFSSSCWRTIH